MKKNYLLFLFAFFTFFGYSQVTITPSVFAADQQITITVSFASATCNGMGSSPAKVYMHAGIGNDANAFGYGVVGNWGLDDNVGIMTNNNNGTWSKTIVPSTYFNITSSQQLTATKLGMVFRNANGSQTLKKPAGCVDFIFDVGAFQATLNSPALNETTIINSGGNLNITASNTNGNAAYELLANGVSISTSNGTSFAFNDVNITTYKNYELKITQGDITFSRRFAVMINPGTDSQIIPAQKLEGINYDANDATKATLVLDAPGKDFVYVVGSFNNWTPNTAYAMKKDATANSTKFWLELNNLTPGENYTYQYWVVDTTPFTNSPALVKTADPYSTLVLSPFDDPQIISENKYPNLPLYPAGQEREVTVLKTGEAPYNWQVTNFVKPDRERLVVYEVLVRDFDSRRSYQDLIDKIGYFKNLQINAIQLMPVMEYEGNESWGYNTSFHMANDKFYGPANKLKEFIDLCHQNGIAVILDVALNHAFGRNPFVRMWMSDPDGDGWGDPSAESPYFNTEAMHSYNVGSDFNHTLERVRTYTKRVIEHWIHEYKIDGFRWDLTKGFTQQCPPNVSGGQEPCTNGYRSDRVEVLSMYARHSWAQDPTHYVIFEHLGQDNEEQVWANLDLNIDPNRGVMMWGNVNTQYNQLSMGFNSNANISRMGHSAHGFSKKRLIGYAESHDEERLMYKNIQNGNSSNSSHNVRNLSVALSRMSAIGAISLLVPGPKMIWHFGELGWESSIFTCNNGSVNTPGDATAGDCKLDTKPQPQWTGNWLGNSSRSTIYNDWAKFIDWKRSNLVFNKDYDLNTGDNNLMPKLYLFDNSNSIPNDQVKNVIVITNFTVASQSIAANFPYAGTWFNLMTGQSFNVTNTAMTFTVAAGQFRVFGNRMPILSTEKYEPLQKIKIYPNPAANYFTVDVPTTKVDVFSMTGQLVKTFKNSFNEESQFDITNLKSGVYIVKLTDEYDRETTTKLVKQ